MSRNADNENAVLQQYDLGEIETATGFFRTLFRLYEIGRECVIPATVVEYDRTTHMASVKPLVKFTKETVSGQETFDRPTYENIPVMQFRHGGFTVDAPLEANETGILIAIDREWTAAREKNANNDPTKNEGSKPVDSFGLASFSNGVFIPDSWVETPFFSGKLSDRLVVGNIGNDGVPEAYLSFGKDGTITANADEKLELISKLLSVGCDAEFEKDVDVAGGLDVHGKLNALGDFSVAGDTDMSGILDVLGEATFHDKVVVKGEERTATIDPSDLGDTDAQFRQVTMVTGFHEKTSDNKVRLYAKKIRVLSDEQEDADDVEFEVGGGGGSGEVEVIGTDDSSESGNVLEFASASDSNVEVSISKDDSGNVVMTVGVYYK